VRVARAAVLDVSGAGGRGQLRDFGMDDVAGLEIGVVEENWRTRRPLGPHLIRRRHPAEREITWVVDRIGVARHA
jgi:hypothetical protein